VEDLPQLKLDDKGLIPAVAQDHLTGDVRMVAWMDLAALRATLDSGKATFFSRSKGRLWVKGETSGHFLHVVSVYVDCDADTLLLRVAPEGPSCHTGRPTCFFRRIGAGGELRESPAPLGSFLSSLEHQIEERQQSTAEKSYTRSLLDGGAQKIGAKMTEEAAEFAAAIQDESRERVASEAADVLYHLMVGLRLRGVALNEVLATLHRRSGISGHQEKAARTHES
jgi:phosphoribosyl-ATP pyrophosphohydrolase/phosphoribosyl-AMP cyclohydrolase